MSPRYAAGSAMGIAEPPDPAKAAKTPTDYSHVASLDIALQLVEQGMLFEITLFPEEFGGNREPHNLIYVPPGIPEIKDLVTETLLCLRNEGLIDRLSFDLEYKGSSFVPSSINVRATHNIKSRTFEPRIGVW
ncbi:hypothetical protein MNR01_04980 [Lysobacter sp. S4-A87]|uniref:hypothetical protein n=1 Tax=Lysobacter sp. S4-A87 TaxID=2925843 RepID=UPI001F52E9CA|nr:hypothetical protein [Lysobacter sp. S4-A87]UNK50378.1 hypothetical protein MNR01_04980 [Lysobacter sp. S4-A87]